MDTPGITVRPLPEIIQPEHPDLNEVFLDDVRVPADHLVGELNNGWVMANGSLAHERGMVWVGAVMGLEEALGQLLARGARDCLARMPPTERAVAVDQIVQLAIDTTAARCLGYRGFAKLARGGTAPEQALMKLFASEARQRVALVAAEIQGADAVEVGGRRARRPPRHRRAAGHLARAVLPVLRQHDLGRRLGDPAQHHRRARARPPPGLT